MARCRSLVASVALALHVGGGAACTIMAVGKDASASGSPMVTHSDDSGPTTTDVRLIRVPRKKWPPNSKRPMYLWQIPYPRVVSSVLSPEYAPAAGQQETEPIGYIPQVPETWAYWDTDYGVQNEWGLAIGESTCTAMTVGWPAGPGRPYGYNHAGIEDLSKIALERCKTARCAVQTMGDIAVEQGFYSADSGPVSAPAYAGSSEGLVVIDATPGETWIFNVLTGRNNASAIWAAQRVPSDHVVAVGNSFTIRKLDLSDTENFLYSPGVTELAEEKGWGRPVNGIFDFFGAYGYQPPPGGNPGDVPNVDKVLSFYSGRRMWRIFSLLSPAEGAKLDPNKGNLPKTKDPYPPSVPAPKGSVTLTMVMNAHRDHYEGTQYDLTKGMSAGPYGNPNRGKTPPAVAGQWERAISMFRSSWSFVNVARPNRRSLLWFGYDAAHGTAYLPFYGAAESGGPPSYHSHEGYMSKFSFNVAWWPFNIVNQYSDRNFLKINADVRAKADAVEKEAMKAVEAWEAEADAISLPWNSTGFRIPGLPGGLPAPFMGGGFKEKAQLALLTARSNGFAEAKVAEWWELAWSLFVKYGRYVVTYNESATTGTDVLGQVYPDWWLKSMDVGFAAWEPQGPYHGIPDAIAYLNKTVSPPTAAATAAAAAAGLPPAAMLVAVATAAAMLAVAGLGVYRAGVREGHRQSFQAGGYLAQP